MIPAIIHQTWKDKQIPGECAGYERSWGRFNPSWQRILWTDRMLLDFVAQYYPDILELYCSYANPVCRADAARYMLLHKYGGLYADIDVECLAPLTPLEGEVRAVLCKEPPSHWPAQAPYRSHDFILFNGVMASPPGHPFWQRVLDRLYETRHGTSVIDMTGPCLLTGVYLGFDERDSIAVHDCALFTPTDRSQQLSPSNGDRVQPSLTRHYWAGSWLQPAGRKKRLRRGLVSGYHRFRYLARRGPALDPAEAQQRIDSDVLKQPPPKGDRLAILVPVRDAAAHLDPFIEMVSNLDIPKKKTKLVFCEGDSVDGTQERLGAVAPILRNDFRDVVLLKKDVGTRFKHINRSDRGIQRERRSGLATVRNHLIDYGLDHTDDWALWIDVDVWRSPPNIFWQLRSADARIVVPNCVKVSGGPTFDMNSFVSNWNYSPYFYYRHIRGGLFQPPHSEPNRLHLHDLRHSERVKLDAVGGTMLLVDASLHRGGLRFPEIPYKDLIETEAFGLLARDVGVGAIGLPRVEVLHVPY